jgi:transposase-like protein
VGKWRPNVERDMFGREGVYMIKPWQTERVAQAHWGVECKHCGAENVVRFGSTAKGVQRFLCRACERTFVDNNAPPYMRFPVEVIASALNQFYESTSLHKIQRTLRLDHGMQPDPSNIYRWIVKYTKIAVREFEAVPVNVGDTWIADETVLKLKVGGNHWFWDIIDRDTRFLLASHLSKTRYTRDAETLMERALRRAGGIPPKAIITDKLRSYLGGIERVFGADSQHIQSGPFALEQSSRDIERFHGTLKDRTKVLRSLANSASAKIVLDGWIVHYNFFRPHQGLKGKTPAEAATARGVPFSSWADVVVGGRNRETNPRAEYTVRLVRP